MELTFTVGELIAGILAICTGVTVIATAISWLAKGVAKMSDPQRKLDERITKMEERLARHDELLGKDKARLEAIEEGNRVTQRAILALLEHGIDGNNVEAMRSAKDELTKYLIER